MKFIFLSRNKNFFEQALFIPEGGNLVLNTANHIAFKAIGRDGKGVTASGRILDNSGETITTFETSFLGMGKFIFRIIAPPYTGRRK